MLLQNAILCRDFRSSKCTTIVFDTSGKWEKLQSEKFILYFGHLLSIRINFKKKFSFKFTLRCQQSDIVPIICCRYLWQWWQICHWYHKHQWYGWKICHRCCLYWWCTLTCEYLREFLNDPNIIIRAWGKKNSWHYPFKLLFWEDIWHFAVKNILTLLR